MTDVATSLLDFILSLLRDPQAAAAFQAHPEASLRAAGLSSVSAADVHAVLPVALDYAPVSLHSSFDRSYSGALGGGIHAPVTTGASMTPPVTHTEVAAATATATTPHTGIGSSGLGASGVGVGPSHAVSTGVSPSHASSGAVAQLQNIINNYSYTTVDDRTTILDHSVNQDVYALGDVTQFFDDHSATATGDGAVAGQSINGPVTTGSNNLVADHSDVGNTDASVNLRDSFNGNGNDSSHHDTTTTTTTNTTNLTDNSTNDSFNPDRSFNTRDSFNDDSQHPTTTSTATTNTTTNTSTTNDSHALANVGNDSHAVTGSAVNALNGSGNDSSDHSTVDDHTATDVNAAFVNAHDDNSTHTDDHSVNDDSTNTSVDHNLVLDHAALLP